MKKTIATANYNDGLSAYTVEKEENDREISIVVYDVSNGRHKEKSRLEFKHLAEEYISPFLSWYNLIFCSNNYGAAPDYDYMNTAVQEGKKTAATVYLEPYSEKGKALKRTLPNDCDARPYGKSMIYVFHKGCLSDFFDYDQIKAIYEKHGGYSLDWDIIKEFFQKDLSFFRKEEKCGFSLQSGGNKEQTIITGLLLGYPVESTIAFLGLDKYPCF